jgi:hypothetical protein
MTGRAAGFCAGFDAPGYANPAPGGRGLGAGYGRGRGFGGGGHGWRNRFYATGLPGWARYGAYAPPEDSPAQAEPEREKRALKNQVKALQWQIDMVNNRLAEIEGGKSKD